MLSALARAVPQVAAEAAGSAAAQLEASELALLAMIQGLTEFLPVSSSGHLALAGHALGGAGPALWIEVALHVGTLAAVLVVYRFAVRDVVRGLLGGRPHEALCVILATLPIVVVGFTLKDALEQASQSERLVGWGLLGTAVILTIGEWARRRNLRAAAADATGLGGPESELSLRAALFIGLAQTIAILPGVSRSGTTIAAGLVCGLSPVVAARFSFLLSIPAILGACLLTAKDADPGALGGTDLGPLLWAMGLAGLIGWAALRVLIAFLGRGAFQWFAAYCLVLAMGVFFLF